MNRYEDPRTPLGPRARAALDRLETEPLPRKRCAHLAADPSQGQQVFASWHRSEVTCPSCTLTEVSLLHSVARAGTWSMTCSHCSHPTWVWTSVLRNLGAIVLMAPLCPVCADADERDALAEADYIPADATPNGS